VVAQVRDPRVGDAHSGDGLAAGDREAVWQFAWWGGGGAETAWSSAVWGAVVALFLTSFVAVGITETRSG
jgi:hypothetical protein